jgi:isoleucyl-tRNA synthetase
VSRNNEIEEAAKNNLSYICTEILADSIDFVDIVQDGNTIEINESKLEVLIEKY